MKALNRFCNIIKSFCIITIAATILAGSIFQFPVTLPDRDLQTRGSFVKTNALSVQNIPSSIIYPSNHNLLGQPLDMTANSQVVFFSEKNSGVKAFSSAGEFKAVAVYPIGSAVSYESVAIFENVLFTLNSSSSKVDMFDTDNIVGGKYKYIDSFNVKTNSRTITVTANGSETMLFVSRDTATGSEIIDYNIVISKSVSGNGTETTVLSQESFTLTTRLTGITKMRSYTQNSQTLLALLAGSNLIKGGSSVFTIDISNIQNNLISGSAAIDNLIKDILKDDATAIGDFDFTSGGDIIYITDIQIITVSIINKLIDILDYDSSAAVAAGKLKSPRAIKIIDGTLFIADALSGTGFIQSFSYNKSLMPALSFIKSVVYSNDSSAGRFASPRSSAIKGDNLYVADYQNNRVDIINCSTGDASRFNYTFIRPSLIEIAGDGTIFIVDNTSRLSVFDGNHSLKATINSLKQISDITASSDYTVYAADMFDNKIYHIGSSYEPEEFYSGLNAKRIAADNYSNILYALDFEDNFYSLENNTETIQPVSLNIASSSGDIQDFTVDYGKNIFALSENILYKYEYDRATNSYISAIQMNVLSENESKAYDWLYSLEINVDINDTIGYGDIVLCDSKAGSIRKISALDAEVVSFDYSGLPRPVDYLDPVGAQSANDISVRKTKTSAIIYKYPSSHEKIITINSGYTVLILQYNLSATDYFCMVAVELKEEIDFESQRTAFICGYMLKDALTDAEKIIEYTFSNARVLNDNTAIYKYPSLLSVKLNSGGNQIVLTKDKDLTVLPWAYKYTDRNGYEWVAVDYNGTIGFVLSPNLIARHYQILSSRPRPNATIATDNITGIPVYKKINEDFVKLDDITIPKKARVSIVGDFDQNSEYTEIIYTDTNGSLQCYVATRYINTDNLSTAQIVALALLLILIVIAITLYLLKRNSKSKTDNENVYLN